ncbi:DUF6193 family natural product biosynthesis protein [Flavobacterium sediminilitoris]|uniref:DUF6193 family natural product biosynthesis protein n=1 Tax=Flavobacterium sediminilitoris TaxID=2024526 RepID=A0ABY4HL66_9FLAO|nr:MULTISPECIES: DUF6193 family natural product biosynthesis protein [Flavobacterium]UOX32962.1 DUF6193 family natural product biosynthesis protein [Flavobacterium sediminilitoris]
MWKKFLNIFKSKTTIQKMYPELENVGGLRNAIDIELKKLNSTLKVSQDNELDKIPLTYARIENGHRFSQVYISAEEKIYLSDFWKEGVCLANGQTKDISELAQVIDFWLCNDISTKELADKFLFVLPNDKAFAFDENKEVEYAWNLILNDQSKPRTELNAFLKLAINDNILNKLFPFTSLYTLCFSRCTGYPYDTLDLPNVTPKQFENYFPIKGAKRINELDINRFEIQFVVTKNRNEYLGEGNAEEALKIVKANLPDNIEPARKGTADD